MPDDGGSSESARPSRVAEVFADGTVLRGEVWTFRTAAAAGGPLLPGDCNLDGQVDLSDVVCVLGLLFLGDSETPCGGSFTDAANTALLDWNGDGALDVSDPIATLAYLFGASGEPHALGMGCVFISPCPDACP